MRIDIESVGDDDMSALYNAVHHRPSDYSTSDERRYRTHSVAFAMHRTSTALGCSNYRIAVEYMREHFDEFTEERMEEKYWFTAHESHWAVGWVDTLFVQTKNDDGSWTDAWRAVTVMHKMMRTTYPALTTDDFMELEHEMEEGLDQEEIAENA